MGGKKDVAIRCQGRGFQVEGIAGVKAPSGSVARSRSRKKATVSTAPGDTSRGQKTWMRKKSGCFSSCHQK